MFGALWSALFGGMLGKPKKTPGLFTEGGQTFGEEALGLAPEEIEKRRKTFKANRTPTLLTGARRPAPYVLGADDPRRQVSWRTY